MAERHRPQPVEHAAIDALQMLDDRQHVARARLYACARAPAARRRGRDRPGIGLEAEQARADLVVQLERGAPPLVVLRGDQPVVEPLVLGARGVERLRQRIETVGDGGELLRRGRGSRTW